MNKDELFSLFEGNKFEEIFTFAKEIASNKGDTKTLKKVINIKAQYDDLRNKIQLGLIDETNQRINLNKIRKVLLDLCLDLLDETENASFFNRRSNIKYILPPALIIVFALILWSRFTSSTIPFKASINSQSISFYLKNDWSIENEKIRLSFFEGRNLLEILSNSGIKFENDSIGKLVLSSDRLFLRKLALKKGSVITLQVDGRELIVQVTGKSAVCDLQSDQVRASIMKGSEMVLDSIFKDSSNLFSVTTHSSAALSFISNRDGDLFLKGLELEKDLHFNTKDAQNRPKSTISYGSLYINSEIFEVLESYMLNVEEIDFGRLGVKLKKDTLSIDLNGEAEYVEFGYPEELRKNNKRM